MPVLLTSLKLLNPRGEPSPSLGHQKVDWINGWLTQAGANSFWSPLKQGLMVGSYKILGLPQDFSSRMLTALTIVLNFIHRVADSRLPYHRTQHSHRHSLICSHCWLLTMVISVNITRQVLSVYSFYKEVIQGSQRWNNFLSHLASGRARVWRGSPNSCQAQPNPCRYKTEKETRPAFKELMIPSA
jgi:hypothetical protein